MKAYEHWKRHINNRKWTFLSKKVSTTLIHTCTLPWTTENFQHLAIHVYRITHRQNQYENDSLTEDMAQINRHWVSENICNRKHGRYSYRRICKIITLRTYDTFPTFSLENFFQPPSFEEFLEINFQFSMVSILHR
jgi:hypothetical protein